MEFLRGAVRVDQWAAASIWLVAVRMLLIDHRIPSSTPEPSISIQTLVNAPLIEK